MADKFGGARVTHYHTLLMTIITIILGILVNLARTAKSGRQDYCTFGKLKSSNTRITSTYQRW